MVKTRLFISLIIFAVMLFCISMVKNKSRIIEKSIELKQKNISSLKNDLYETQLDYFYLSSSENLSNTMKRFNKHEFKPIGLSNIYSNFDDYIEEKSKTPQVYKKIEKKIQKK